MFYNIKTLAYLEMISLLFCVRTETAWSMITYEIKLCADRKLGGQEHQIFSNAFV